MVILALLLLLVIVWVFFASVTRDDPGVDLSYLMDLGDRLDLPDFDLVESEESKTVFVRGEVPIIHLCLRGPSGASFDTGTVVMAFIHEAAHLVCPDSGHTDHFYAVEESLMRRVVDMGLLRSGQEMDPSYPCIA